VIIGEWVTYLSVLKDEWR